MCNTPFWLRFQHGPGGKWFFLSDFRMMGYEGYGGADANAARPITENNDNFLLGTRKRRAVAHREALRQTINKVQNWIEHLPRYEKAAFEIDREYDRTRAQKRAARVAAEKAEAEKAEAEAEKAEAKKRRTSARTRSQRAKKEAAPASVSRRSRSSQKTA